MVNDFVLEIVALFPDKVTVDEVIVQVPLLVSTVWNAMESVLLVNCSVPLLVIVFKLLPPSVREEPDGNANVQLAPMVMAIL